MDNAGLIQRGSRFLTQEARAVVGLQDDGRLLRCEQPIEGLGHLRGASAGKRRPGEGIARGQISHGKDEVIASVDRFRGLGQIGCPDGTGLRPSQGVETGAATATVGQAIGPEESLQSAARRPGKQSSKSRDPDVRTKCSEEILQQFPRPLVQPLRGTTRVSNVGTATTPVEQGSKRNA